MKTFFIIMTLISLSCFAQDYDPKKFFPYEKGNMWEYLLYEEGYKDTLQMFIVWDSVGADNNISITKKGRLINPLYEGSPYGIETSYIIDTLNQVWTDIGYDELGAIYKLDARQGDKWIMKTHYDGSEFRGYEISVVDTVWEGILFGHSTVFKQYTWYFALDTTRGTCENGGCLEKSSHILAYGFGEFWFGGGDLWTDHILKGAIINSILYGDTTLITSVMDLSSNIPDNLELLQNYPNPFNPSTTISFNLKSSGIISLIIYDSMGREIFKLIDNQWVNYGNYKVNWNGNTSHGNKAASGVYYYQLTDKESTVTQKMVLVQ